MIERPCDSSTGTCHETVYKVSGSQRTYVAVAMGTRREENIGLLTIEVVWQSVSVLGNQTVSKSL